SVLALHITRQIHDGSRHGAVRILSSSTDGEVDSPAQEISHLAQSHLAGRALFGGRPTHPSSHSFEWPISGTANAPFVLQASTDLITWKSLATNSHDGSVFTYSQWSPTSQQRFYRIAS